MLTGAGAVVRYLQLLERAKAAGGPKVCRHYTVLTVTGCNAWLFVGLWGFVGVRAGRW